MSPEAMDAYHISLRTPPIVPRRFKEDNRWTLVTGFFDLHKMPDVTQSSRTLKHYLHHSRTTLSLNQNMVVFCEEETYPFFYSEREKFGLLEKTTFHVVQFNDFPLCAYREKIVENRKTHPPFDNRNNPSYYLLCMSRYAMLKQAIRENVFDSTHFAWINICISRMGLRNAELLETALLEYRDRFSTVWIDYISEADIRRSNDFMWHGRCGMCSGFFTGKSEYMEKVCTLLEEKFLYYLERGFGHADEQLYSPVYYEHPELFEHYFGDYQQMITNYTKVVENPYTTLRFLIPRALNAGDHKVLVQACKSIYDGYKALYYSLLEPQLIALLMEYFIGAWYCDLLDVCISLVRKMMVLCEKPSYKPHFQANQRHILKQTDFLAMKVKTLPKKVVLTIDDVEEEDLKAHTVYVYGEYPFTSKAFILNNPILRHRSLLDL